MTKAETGKKPPAAGAVSAESLASSARQVARKGPAPVHLWDPPFCGDLDIRIARDGTWFYLGTPIGRPELVRLFASILKREGSEYFLVTPVEKVRIRVDDAPFVAVDFEVRGRGRAQVLTFETNLGDRAEADPDRPLRFERNPTTGEPAPYVMIRSGLEALIDRKSFLRLAELGVHEERDDGRWFGLWSGGVFFPVIPSRELEI